VSRLLAELQRLSEAASQESAAPTADLGIAFLARQLPERTQRHLQLVAIPHHFDPAIVRALDPSATLADAVETCDTLIRVALATELDGALRLHDQVRRVLFEQWLARFASPEFQTANRRLEELFGAPADGADPTALMKHRVFHAVGADPERGITLFENECRAARRLFRLADCGGLVTLVEEYRTVLPPSLGARVDYQRAKLHTDFRRYEDGASLLVRIAGNEAAPTALQVRALIRLATIYRAQRRWSQAVDVLGDAAGRASVKDHPHEHLRTLVALGATLRDSGDHDEGLKKLQEAVTLSAEWNERLCAAEAQNAIGILHLQRRDIDQSLRAFEAARKELDAEGLRSSQLLHNIGSAHLEAANFNESRRLFEESLSLQRSFGDIGGQAMTLNSLARVNAIEGRHTEALDLNQQAIDLLTQVHDYLRAAEALRNRGRLYLHIDLKRIPRSQRADQVARAQVDARNALADAAQLFERCGASDLAADAARESVAAGKRVGIPWWGWVVIVGALTLVVLGLARGL